jgi:hypothetical protein
LLYRKHPGEWKLALETAENSKECLETPQSSGTLATSQTMPRSQTKGPLQQIMLKSQQSNFDTNIINSPTLKSNALLSSR